MTRRNLNHKRVFLDPLDYVFDRILDSNLQINLKNTENEPECRVGLIYKLKPADSSHWIKVLRANTGQQLEVTCARSAKTFKAFITTITKDLVCIKLHELVGSEKQEGIAQQHLFIGLPKSKSLELLIEKAVELSVASINIWEAKHSVAKLKENKEIRLLKIIESAAKQSKQNRLAELKVLDSLSALESRIQELQNIENTQSFICSLVPDSMKIQSIELNSHENQLIALGPEGDFSTQEEELFKKHNFQAIRLCSSVLRTETAGIVALSMLQARMVLS